MNTNFYLREKRQICLLASDHITNDLNLQINCKELHGMKSKAFSISFKLHLSTQVKKWVCNTPMQFGLACAAYKINHNWGMPKKGPMQTDLNIFKYFEYQSPVIFTNTHCSTTAGLNCTFLQEGMHNVPVVQM